MRCARTYNVPLFRSRVPRPYLDTDATKSSPNAKTLARHTHCRVHPPPSHHPGRSPAFPVFQVVTARRPVRPPSPRRARTHLLSSAGAVRPRRGRRPCSLLMCLLRPPHGKRSCVTTTMNQAASQSTASQWAAAVAWRRFHRGVVTGSARRRRTFRRAPTAYPTRLVGWSSRQRRGSAPPGSW